MGLRIWGRQKWKIGIGSKRQTVWVVLIQRHLRARFTAARLPSFPVLYPQALQQKLYSLCHHRLYSVHNFGLLFLAIFLTNISK